MLDKKVLIVKIMEIKMHTNSTRNDPSIDESFLAEKLKHHFLSFSLFPLFFLSLNSYLFPFLALLFQFFLFYLSSSSLSRTLLLNSSSLSLSLFFPRCYFLLSNSYKNNRLQKMQHWIKKKGHYQVYILASRIMHA